MSFGFGAPSAAGGGALTEGFCATPGSPDSVSKLSWSKGSSQFVATSNWDGQVRLYQQQQNGTFAHVAAAATNANAPVLSVDWATDGASLFTCGADNMAMRCALANGAIQPTPVAKHDAPIKAMSWWSDVNLLVTGGFDDKMMFWDTRQAQPVHTMPCPGKVQCIASKGPTMVMTCLHYTPGEQHCKSAVFAFDRSNPGANIRMNVPDAHRAQIQRGQTFQPTSLSPASLNHQIRSIGMMKDGIGWALGGSEGRCVVEYRHDVPVPPATPTMDILFKDAVPKRSGPVQHPMTVNFNFKCHRNEEKQGQQTISNAFPCNAVAFNSKYNTMATCGSDGTFVFWDKDNRQKLKSFPEQPQARAGGKPAAAVSFGNSIIDIDFSPDSNFVAFAVAYDWAKGPGGRSYANEGLYVKRVPDQDIAPKKPEQKTGGFQGGGGYGGHRGGYR